MELGGALVFIVVLAVTHAAEHNNRFSALLQSQEHHVMKRSTYKGYGSRGCLDLRSKRYISDGFCTTVRPIAETVCVARCQENDQPSSYAGDLVHNPTTTHNVEWRCTQGATRRKMVRFLCRDGTRRVYQIRLVTKCDCKKVHIDNNSKQSSSTRDKTMRKMKRIQ